MYTTLATTLKYGYFSGEVFTAWGIGTRNMRNYAPIAFTDPRGYVWYVPTGHITDGLSIPRLFWTLVASPYTSKGRMAAVIHDYYCRNDRHLHPSNEVHWMFYNACRANGCNELLSRAMYAGVMLGGPKWTINREV
jgi:hypothetical protein